uniref:Hint domain-containing homing endonuclease n=1 Tax=Pseudomonas sp. TaxID=306 RepID=UPI00258B2A87
MSSIQLRPYQAAGVEAIRASFKAKNRAVLYVLPTGGGKCMGAGTPILMFDGSVKLVENVVVGDLLMGPDSKPRTVLSLARGSEMLYRVTPVKGDSYVVNESHILSLKRTGIRSDPQYPSQQGGAVVNIGVLDYLASSRTFKHEHKGWRAAVDFPAHDSADVIEAYFLGIWLGDGHSHVAEITTGDQEMISYVTDYAERLGMKAVTHQNSVNSIGIRIIGHTLTGRGGTTIMNALRSYDLCRNKHIPHRWKTGSRIERLELLAGLIDSDGSYTGKGFDVSLKSEVLMDDLIFVARSLGFSAYKSACRKTCHNNGVTGDYWRCTISGAVEQIPCKVARKKANPRAQKKSALVTGISVESIGYGDYFGFEIDGDHLFMLGDFTVTHNTFTFSYVADGATKKQNKVLILVHRKELLMQASMSLAKMGLKHHLIAQTEHVREIQHQQLTELNRLYLSENAKIAIASVGTLVNRLSTTWAPDLIIPDEAHHCQKDNTWGKIL